MWNDSWCMKRFISYTAAAAAASGFNCRRGGRRAAAAAAAAGRGKEEEQEVQQLVQRACNDLPVLPPEMAWHDMTWKAHRGEAARQLRMGVKHMRVMSRD